MRIALASTNKHKALELKTVASKFGIEVLSIEELQTKLGLPFLPEIEENGSSYQENALIKAKACFEWSGIPSLGDDSGLEVSALGGAPGIHSARYAGPGASDNEKVEKLLRELKSQETTETERSDRQAKFRAVLCYISGKNTAPLYCEGTLDGEVLESPKGVNGFGYDPIIHIPELGGTLAEFNSEIICEKGFRAKAAHKLFSYLANKPE